MDAYQVVAGIALLILVGRIAYERGLNIGRRRGFDEGVKTETDRHVRMEKSALTAEGKVGVAVEHVTLDVKCSRRRNAQRGYPANEALVKWAQRWLRNTRSTLTAPITIEAAEIGEDFIQNKLTFRIYLRAVRNGRTLGLGEYLTVDRDTHALTLTLPEPHPYTLWKS